MRITPVLNISNNTRQPRKITNQPVFTAEPHINRASCFFRRGAVFIASEGYNDVETIFNTVLKNNNGKKNMLIIGIGHSQEPFSYSASIKGIIGKRQVKDCLDLNIIDLQPKPDYNELKRDAFCNLRDYEKLPKFAKKGIVKDSYKKWLGYDKNAHYNSPIMLMCLQKEPEKEVLYDRVNDEIFEFISDTYNNPLKSKWNTPVQDVLEEYPDNKYTFVSANNILGYIDDDKDFVNTYKNIVRILKPNGYFITDPYKFEPIIKESGVVDNLEEVYKGIYRKME